MVTTEQRISIFKQSSVKQQYFYSSSDSGKRLSTIANTFSLSEPDRYKIFSLTIGDIILGFYKIEDTVPLLQQELGIDPKTAALLGAEVLEFLAPLNDPHWQPPTEDDGVDSEDTNPTLPVVSETRIPVKAPAVYTEPSAATPVPLINSAMETPVSQSATIPAPSYEPAPATPTPQPIYQSSQPTTIRSTLSNIPSYTPPATPITPPAPTPAPDRPRWSTDI